MDTKYRCLKCGHTWETKPDMVACPKCQSPHVRWVNYEAWAKANPSASDPARQ